MTRIGEALPVNDFSHLSDAEVGVWVDPDLSLADGLMGEICPSVFEVGIDGTTHTRLGAFLGSTASHGIDGLRPVLSTELEAVIEALNKDPTQSGDITTEPINPSKQWPLFIARSVIDMTGAVSWGLRTLEPGDTGFEDLLGSYLYGVATIIQPESVEIPDYEYRRDGKHIHSTPTDTVIAQIDVFELFGLDGNGGYSEGDRDEIASTLRYLADNLDLPDLVEKRSSLVLEPLAYIAERVKMHLEAA